MSTRAHPNYGSAHTPNERVEAASLRHRLAPRCVLAYRNIKKICHEHIGNKRNIEVVDLLDEPEVAR